MSYHREGSDADTSVNAAVLLKVALVIPHMSYPDKGSHIATSFKAGMSFSSYCFVIYICSPSAECLREEKVEAKITSQNLNENYEFIFQMFEYENSTFFLALQQTIAVSHHYLKSNRPCRNGYEYSSKATNVEGSNVSISHATVLNM